jgi:hypothetical protein
MNAPARTAAEVSAGHNKPAILTADMMARDFAYIDDSLSEIETKVSDCPPVIEDDADLEIIREAVKRCQGAVKRLKTLKDETKEPYLSAERVVQSYFANLWGKVETWQGGLEARAHRYLKKKEAAEKARREEEARKAAETARAAAERQRQAEDERRQAEQQRIASEQATQRISVEHHQREENARIKEARVREEAAQAQASAIRTQKEAEAKPADLARTRSADGLSTLQEIWCFEVLDPHAIDLQDPVLRSFIPWPDIEKALGRYVKTHKGDRPLNGIRIYSDTKPMMT